MNGQILWLTFLVLCGVVVCVIGFLVRVPITPPEGSADLTPEPRINWSWNEKLILFVAGACMGGFIFCGILSTNLSPPNRPVVPEPALGYTHFFKAKHGQVYGTLFEYLAVSYGVFAMWGIGALIGLIFFSLNGRNLPGYRRNPWPFLAGLAISMPLYYVIWQLANYVARP